jgi:hypothetical protein
LRERAESVPETKTYTLASPPTQATSNWTPIILEIAQIAQGTDVSNRIGDMVHLKQLAFRMVWYANQAQTIATTGRTMIFIDTMNTGTAPVGSDVLDSAALGSAAAPFANYNVVNYEQKRFKILFDRTFGLGISGNNAFAGDIARVLPLKVPLHFGNSGGSNGQRNRLYLLYVSDVNTNDLLFTFQAQTRFTDA